MATHSRLPLLSVAVLWGAGTEARNERERDLVEPWRHGGDRRRLGLVTVLAKGTVTITAMVGAADRAGRECVLQFEVPHPHLTGQRGVAPDPALGSTRHASGRADHAPEAFSRRFAGRHPWGADIPNGGHRT